MQGSSTLEPLLECGRSLVGNDCGVRVLSSPRQGPSNVATGGAQPVAGGAEPVVRCGVSQPRPKGPTAGVDGILALQEYLE